MARKVPVGYKPMRLPLSPQSGKLEDKLAEWIRRKIVKKRASNKKPGPTRKTTMEGLE